MTQAALALAAGVPQSTVARIESDRVDPRVATLDRLLRACRHRLGVDSNWAEGVDVSLIDLMLEMSPSDRSAYGHASSVNLARSLDVPAEGH